MLARLLKLALTLALLGAAAPDAWARIKYVHPSGSTNYTNASNSNQPCDLATANTNAVAGDTLMMYGGTYTTPIGPSSAGTSYAAMITYRAHSGMRDSVQINANCGVSAPSGNRWTVADSLIRIEHVRFLLEPPGAYYYENMHRVVMDSVSFHGRAPYFGSEGSYGCKITNTIDTVTTGVMWAGPDHTTRCDAPDLDSVYTQAPGYSWHVRDTLEDVHVRYTGTWRTATQKLIGFNATYGLVATRLKVYFRGDDTGGTPGDYKSFFHAYNMQAARFTDCVFDMVSYQTAGIIWGFTMRDFSKDNVFLRDTISLVNREGAPLYFSMGHSGSCDNNNFNNTFDGSLLRRVSTGASANILGYYDENVNHTNAGANVYKNSVIIDSLAGIGSVVGLANSSVRDNISNSLWPRTNRALFKNNTIITWVASGPALAFNTTTGDTSNKFTPAGASDPERRSFYNNIIYAPNAARAVTWDGAIGSRAQKKVPGDAYYTRIDTIDKNVYWSGAATDTAIEWVDPATQEIKRTQPVASGTTWQDTYANDINSKNISPLFADSSWASLWTGNVALAAGSAAIDAGINGGEENIGAWEEGGEADVTDPTVSLTVPDGGQSWNEGQGRTITWTASDNVGVTAIGLWYSTNGGSNWTSIAQGETNDGAYLWTVPNVERESNNMRIRVWATDAAGNDASDSSSTSFTVLDTLRPNKVRNLWAYEVGQTSVKLKWTGVANCSTTVVKYDTRTLTESGADNFRTHGTSVSTGTPSAAGALDSCTITGLTPQTRYYFALRHIDNDGVLAETSLVSIPIARTTKRGGLRGSAERSSRPYPLIGMEMVPFFSTVVEADSFPRDRAGWPVYDGTVLSFTLSDTARKAMYAADMITHHNAHGTVRYSDPTYWARNENWGVPDSIFKSIVPTGVVNASGGGGTLAEIQRQIAPEDSADWANGDSPWDYDDIINWYVNKYGRGPKHNFTGNYFLPESLFLWHARQTQDTIVVTGYNDTCLWTAWYGDKSVPCWGTATSSPPAANLNIMHVDTLTGELDVLEQVVHRRVYNVFGRPKYIASNNWQQDVLTHDFSAGWPDDRLGVDSLDYTRSGAGTSLSDAFQKFRGASDEFFARAYVWKDFYRPDSLGTMTVNYFSADISDRMGWDVTDSGEMTTHVEKGGLGFGIQKFFHPASWWTNGTLTYPTQEPSFAPQEFARHNDSPSERFAIRWNIYHIDSTMGWQPIDTIRIQRLRLATGIASMFNNIYVHPTRASDNNSQYEDPSVPTAMFRYLNHKLDWFYLDEAFVDVATRRAQLWGAWGTGTGRNWLGAPQDDKWQYGKCVAAATDSELVGGAKIAANTACDDTTGWRVPTGYPSANEWGKISIVSAQDGNKCFKIERYKTDHSAHYQLALYTRRSYPVGTARTSIRFRAKADTVTYIEVGLRDEIGGGSSWNENNRTVYLDTTWRTYEHQVGLAPSGVRKNGQIFFQFSDTLGTVYLDSITAYNRGVGVLYRTFANGIVYVNPDSSENKLVNVATLFGDTASYDYANIDAVNLSPSGRINNGRIFGHGSDAIDTIPPGQAKFTIRKSNNFWNTFAQGGNFKGGRVPRGRPRGR